MPILVVSASSIARTYGQPRSLSHDLAGGALALPCIECYILATNSHFAQECSNALPHMIIAHWLSYHHTLSCVVTRRPTSKQAAAPAVAPAHTNDSHYKRPRHTSMRNVATCWYYNAIFSVNRSILLCTGYIEQQGNESAMSFQESASEDKRATSRTTNSRTVHELIGHWASNHLG